MIHRSIHLLLLVNAEGARAHVDQQEEPAAVGMVRGQYENKMERLGYDSHNGKNLEEIVFGKVLVRVMFVQLLAEKSAHPS